jgi:hypothetical protein
MRKSWIFEVKSTNVKYEDHVRKFNMCAYGMLGEAKRQCTKEFRENHEAGGWVLESMEPMDVNVALG